LDLFHRPALRAKKKPSYSDGFFRTKFLRNYLVSAGAAGAASVGAAGAASVAG